MLIFPAVFSTVTSARLVFPQGIPHSDNGSLNEIRGGLRKNAARFPLSNSAGPLSKWPSIIDSIEPSWNVWHTHAHKSGRLNQSLSLSVCFSLHSERSLKRNVRCWTPRVVRRANCKSQQGLDEDDNDTISLSHSSSFRQASRHFWRVAIKPWTASDCFRLSLCGIFFKLLLVEWWTNYGGTISCC